MGRGRWLSFHGNLAQYWSFSSHVEEFWYSETGSVLLASVSIGRMPIDSRFQNRSTALFSGSVETITFKMLALMVDELEGKLATGPESR